MRLAAERQAVVDTCKKMQDQNLVVGTAGNVSIRVGDEVVISPSGMPYETLTADQVGIHDMDGKAIDAKYAPSSELPLHLSVYQAYPWVKAITHNHAYASTALGLVIEDTIPMSHYYSTMFGGPIRVAPYARFGTDQLAINVTDALKDRKGCLMANHGAITLGETIEKAFDLLPYLEYICEIQLRAMATGQKIKVLTDEEVSDSTTNIAGYGVQGK